MKLYKAQVKKYDEPTPTRPTASSPTAGRPRRLLAKILEASPKLDRGGR